MQKILILLLSINIIGCASYNVNGVEPGDNQVIKVVGGILLLGALSKNMSKDCPNKQTIRDNNGKIVGTIGNC